MKRLVTIVIAIFVVLFVLHWLFSPNVSDNHQSFQSAGTKNTQAAEPPVKDWQVWLATEILASDDIATRYAWKLTITNESSEVSGFNGEIEFFDANGFALDRNPVYDSSRPKTEYTMRNGYVNAEEFRLLVPAKSQAVFTGTADVQAVLARKVARIEPQIHKETYYEQPKN